MGFRFRKSIKLGKGLKLNLGKKGFTSVTIGGRGASVNIGKRGTHLNAGIPGTGLSYRTKLSGNKSRATPSGPRATRASVSNELTRLSKLYDKGVLSESEFELEKDRVLGYYQEEPVKKKSTFWKLIKTIFWVFLFFAIISQCSKSNKDEASTASSPKSTSEAATESNRTRSSNVGSASNTVDRNAVKSRESGKNKANVLDEKPHPKYENKDPGRDGAEIDNLF
ncbi:DUF4236 domain-containing protein [Neisseriaceae bacterium CLB008]